MQHLLNTRGLDARIAAWEEVIAVVEMRRERDAASRAITELLADYAAVLRALRQLRTATARLEGILQRHAEISCAGWAARTM